MKPNPSTVRTLGDALKQKCTDLLPRNCNREVTATDFEAETLGQSGPQYGRSSFDSDLKGGAAQKGCKQSVLGRPLLWI